MIIGCGVYTSDFFFAEEILFQISSSLSMKKFKNIVHCV